MRRSKKQTLICYLIYTNERGGVLAKAVVLTGVVEQMIIRTTDGFHK